MKHLCLIIFCQLTFVAFLQNDDGAVFDLKKQEKPSDKEGSRYISFYYGMPHLEKAWQTSLFKSQAVTNDDIKDIRSSGFGVIGVRGDYFVSNVVALGFDVMYNRYSISFRDVYQIYDPSYTYLIDMEDQYKYTMERLRIQFRANFHFNIKNPLVELYGGVGIGLNYRNIGFRKNGQEETEITSYLEDGTLVLPISGRICFGYRQILKNNFALSFEAGLGGSLFSMGLAYKF